jgi:phage terminase small subunit
MARNPIPTAVHELRGSFDKNPQRRRNGEPQPKGGIGPAPEHMDEFEQAVWDELVDLAVPNVLGDADRILLERCSKLLAKSRRDPDHFNGTNEGHLMSYLSRMGMTPSDRAKLSVGKKDGGDEFDDL